jgi:hypothetical protein
MWPKQGRGIFIMANGVTGGVLMEIRAAHGQLYGRRAPRVERRTIPVDVATLKSLAGRYESIGPADTLRIDVTFSGNAIHAYSHTARRSFQLLPAAPDTYFDVNSNQTVVFERDNAAAGSPVQAMRLGLAPNARRAIRMP